MKTLGILNGLAVTARHFVESAVGGLAWPEPGARPLRQTPLGSEHGVFTVQYPEERLQLPERARVLPMLVADPVTGEAKCTACGICAKVCPPQAIWIVRAKTPEGKPVPKPEQFVVEAGVCMGCGLCAEYCSFDSIKMNQVYELSTDDPSSLLLSRVQLLISEEYHARLHPKDYEREQEARRAKDAAKREKSPKAPALV
jgi:NADH-quinone oxidoreductase subunit I